MSSPPSKRPQGTVELSPNVIFSTSTSAPMMDESQTLLALPDDALLAVLAFLQLRQLLRCRPVCRRLRDLCLHPQLWRTVKLLELNGDEGLQCAALRLAPCLRLLQVASPFSANLEAAVYSTTCVVSELQLVLEEESGQAFAVAALQLISALGGLRKLAVFFKYRIPSIETTPLLRVAYSLKHINELTFGFASHVLSPEPLPWPEQRSSLTALHYITARGTDDPFLGLILRTHAATLEEVAFYGVLEELPVALLVNMPRLRSFRCPSQDCVSQLQGLPNLESLRVERDGAWSHGLLDYLRQASNLQSVRFGGRNAHIDIDTPLRALAESPCANALQSLSLHCKLDMFELVASTLPQFPSLQTLELHVEDAGPFDTFLRAVSSSTAPCLTELRLAPAGCPHAFLHGPALLDLLARNPRLHFRILSAALPDCACQWCAWGCHVELRGAALRRAFAGHARATDCPKDCFRWRPWLLE